VWEESLQLSMTAAAFSQLALMCANPGGIIAPQLARELSNGNKAHEWKSR
jgi:hypothetical protein